MNYKKDFIKRERVDTNKEKGCYSGIKVIKEPPLRKDETFVLMFRNFIFFDVKSYECRNGDLYIRNIVDGTILKRYFRMDGDDQLTVFKNRKEFDAFMKKVEEEGYHFGPEKLVEFKPRHKEKIKSLLTKASDKFVLENYFARRDSVTGEIDLITSDWDGTSFTRDEAPDFFDKIVKVLLANPGSAQILTKNDYM